MSTNLSSVPKLQFFDNNGNPLVGGKLFTYAAGTTTPLATYTDSTGVTPNTNPIILDSRGEANVWLDATQYKFELKTSADALIWTVDNISNALNLSQLLASSGSAASPPYTFAADTTTGMFLAAAGQIGLSANGTPVLRSTDTQMIIGQSGGADDVDVTHFGDTAQTGNWTLTGDVNVTGAAVFNEAGADKDFRVEGDTDANLLFVDASTDRVGVGTNAPAHTLDVNVASASFRVRNATGGNDFTVKSVAGPITQIGSVANTPLQILTNDLARIHVAAAGNVGIGTNAPQALLHASTISDEVARFESTGLPYLSLYDTNVRQSYWYSASGSIQLVATTGKPLALIAEGPQEVSIFTDNVNRFSVSSTGAQSSVIPSGSTLYPQFACRAWINFDGTSGSIGSGRGSGNVSSVTDNGTGDYTINFTTAMPDGNYAAIGTSKEFDTTAFSTVFLIGARQTIANTFNTNYARVNTISVGGTLTDCVAVSVAIFR
jgi:hypothetical protein